jgi:nitrite reductase (NADH) large subunit
VKTEDEVVEWASAYLQYYREQAQWNERTSTWIERVGLNEIKTALEKPEDRQVLVGRIRKTLSLTTDPWKQIVENDHLRKNFEPLNEAQPINQ